MCTYPDVLLYILSFPCCRVARILKRFVTRHERIDAPVSVVLCLPAHLRVSTAASRGQAPHGNASKAFHRRGVTHPSRATRGHQPRAARRSSSQLAARSAAQRLAAPPSDSAESVTEPAAPTRALPCPRRDREGAGQTRTPSTASPICRPARPHTPSRQPPPKPPADQHRPHSQSSAAAPASTTTTSSLSGKSAHQGPQDQVRPPLPW